MSELSNLRNEADAVNQYCTMETETISKSGRNLKSQTKKGKMFILLLLISMNSFAQFSGGDGSKGNPYIIKTATELAQLATLVNTSTSSQNYNSKYYILNNDIDLSDYQTGEGWIPIGTIYSFTGNFDGNNKKITGLYINNTTLKIVGLFGTLEKNSETTISTTVKNLGVINVNVISSVSAGGVVGYNSG